MERTTMGLKWAKMASDLDNHPKIRKAGPYGCAVFLYALRLNAKHEMSGKVSSEFFNIRDLASALMLSPKCARLGLNLCRTSGLTRSCPDYELIIGWEEDEWGSSPWSMTEADRKRMQRKRNLERSQDQSMNEATEKYIPESYSEPVDCPDKVQTETGIELELDLKKRERREEERKRETEGEGEERRENWGQLPPSRCAPSEHNLDKCNETSDHTFLTLFGEPQHQPHNQKAQKRPSSAQGSTKRVGGAVSPHQDAAMRLWAKQDLLRKQLNPNSHQLDTVGKRGQRSVRRVIENLSSGWTEDQLSQVLDEYAREARESGTMEYFDGVGNWRPDNVERKWNRIGARLATRKSAPVIPIRKADEEKKPQLDSLEERRKQLEEAKKALGILIAPAVVDAYEGNA